MIANEWGPSFTDNYGHVFPNTYLCIDTEYTGGNERDDLIVEIGHIMVQDGEVVDRMNVVLDWTRHEGISSSNLRYKLDNIRSRMGSDWRVTWEVMQEEGISPLKAFRFYDKLFSTRSDRGLPYVAHNGRTAEERMIRGNLTGLSISRSLCSPTSCGIRALCLRPLDYLTRRIYPMLHSVGNLFRKTRIALSPTSTELLALELEGLAGI